MHRDTASTISPRSRYVAGSRHSSRPRSVQCWDALPPARHMFAAAAVPGRCTAKMRTVAFIIYPHGYLCRSTARVNNPFMPNWNMWALEPTSLLSHVGARYTAGAPVGLNLLIARAKRGHSPGIAAVHVHAPGGQSILLVAVRVRLLAVTFTETCDVIALLDVRPCETRMTAAQLSFLNVGIKSTRARARRVPAG